MTGPGGAGSKLADSGASAAPGQSQHMGFQTVGAVHLHCWCLHGREDTAGVYTGSIGPSEEGGHWICCKALGQSSDGTEATTEDQEVGGDGCGPGPSVGSVGDLPSWTPTAHLSPCPPWGLCWGW